MEHTCRWTDRLQSVMQTLRVRARYKIVYSLRNSLSFHGAAVGLLG